MSAPFTAQYWGTCAGCSDRIHPGDRVRFDEDDDLVHLHCSTNPVEPGKICGGCQMEIPAGLSECPDCS